MCVCVCVSDDNILRQISPPIFEQDMHQIVPTYTYLDRSGRTQQIKRNQKLLIYFYKLREISSSKFILL